MERQVQDMFKRSDNATLKRKAAPHQEAREQNKNKKLKPVTHLPLDFHAPLTLSTGPRGSIRKPDAFMPNSRHLLADSVDPRPKPQFSGTGTNTFAWNPAGHPFYRTQCVDNAKFQALYEIFKEQMGDAAKNWVPSGFAQQQGYRGKKLAVQQQRPQIPRDKGGRCVPRANSRPSWQWYRLG